MPTTKPDTASAAAARRYTDYVRRLAEAAPARVLFEALAEPSEAAGLATLMANTSLAAPPKADPLTTARARGGQAKESVLEKAGGGLSVSQVADLLAISAAGVHARRRRGTLLAVPARSGTYLYPACQFGDDGVVGGLEGLLAAFRVEDAWTRLSVLLSPNDLLGGRSPLEAARAGAPRAAADAVAAYGIHLG